MKEIRSTQDIEAKFFAAEMSNVLAKLDLHGRFPEEIGNEVDVFLVDHQSDDVVEIVYGIGRGVLRREVLNFLKNHPMVAAVKEKGASCLVVIDK